MNSKLFNGICLVLLGLITSTRAENDGVIIGSSVGGVLGLIILILDIIAIFELLTSSGRGMCSKLIWILIILFFPVFGLIFYWCCARNRTVDQIV